MDNIDKILKKMETVFQKALSRLVFPRAGKESDLEIELRWNHAFPDLDAFKTPPHMRKSTRLGAEEEPEPGMPPD